MNHSNQQSNSSELDHLFGVCECHEGDGSCFYQREYDKESEASNDDGWIDARIRVSAFKYIKANYLPRKQVEEAIKNSYNPGITDMEMHERNEGEELEVVRVDYLLEQLGLNTKDKESHVQD